MLLHIANFYEASRRTAIAGGDIALGAVIKLAPGVGGERTALQVADGDSALLVSGNYGVAVKVSNDALQVSTSEGVPADWGTRVVAIKSGDAFVEVAKGAVLEYDPSLLHASLDPARAGALPSVGQALAIKDGKFCAAATGGAIASPVIARVFGLVGSKVRVELV